MPQKVKHIFPFFRIANLISISLLNCQKCKYLRKNSVRQPVFPSFLTKTTLSIFTKKLLTRGIKSIIM